MDGRKPRPVESRDPQDKSPKSEVILAGGRPLPEEFKEPPSHLPREAKEFWAQSVMMLVDVGIVDRIDHPALEMLATTYARWRQASRVVASEGHFARGSAGQLREHPALKIERESMALWLKMAEHYAFTPVARTRLGLAELHARALDKELDDHIGAQPGNNGNGTTTAILEADVIEDDDDDVGIPE